MNQIQLFNSSSNQPLPAEHSPNKPQIASPSKLQAKRPANLTVSKIFSDNQKWSQCKIIGKNISIRSYSASCAFQSKFYVYGGYQILNGSLGDFYSIDLSYFEPRFNWVEIKVKGSTNPGPRSKHALVGGKEKIYLIGGLHADVHSSNDIYEFDPKSEKWTLLKPQGIQNIPKIDSFGCVLLEREGVQAIYIIGGYNDEKAEMSNAVYEFIPSKNTVKVLFQNTPVRVIEKTEKTENDNSNVNLMSPRSGLAVTTDSKQNIYLFGGKDQDTRYADLWKFNIQGKKYQRMSDQGQIPAVRNGHSMNYFNGRLYVFGGIHDITWELDDLHIYHIDKGSWTTLEQDSPRKIPHKKSVDQVQKSQRSAEKRLNKKKNWYESVGGGLGVGNTGLSNISAGGRNTHSPMNSTNPARRSFAITGQNNQESSSPGKMIDEQRRKVFYQKKAQMLSNFDVPEKDRQKYILHETGSQAMQNSLDVIGNPDGKSDGKIDGRAVSPAHQHKLTEFGKESRSKFLAPLENNSNLVIGKKPCARDGHCAVMLNDQLIIFGGDRHQMSFNDIYKLNFALAQNEIQVGVKKENQQNVQKEAQKQVQNQKQKEVQKDVQKEVQKTELQAVKEVKETEKQKQVSEQGNIQQQVSKS